MSSKWINIWGRPRVSVLMQTAIQLKMDKGNEAVVEWMKALPREQQIAILEESAELIAERVLVAVYINGLRDQFGQN